MMNKKISVAMPTCNRPKLALQAVTSLYETTNHLNMELALAVDGDRETVDVIESYLSGKTNDNWYYTIDYSPERRGALWSWNYALSLTTGDILFPSGDDQLFYPGWLDRALEYHDEFLDGYGMVAVNDKLHNGNVLGTTLLFDRKFCVDHLGGVCTYPEYNYFYIDNELNERAKLTGRYVWCPESVVEHIHPDAGKRPRDQHDMERNENCYNVIDRQIFESRKSRGFPNNFEPVITLETPQ